MMLSGAGKHEPQFSEKYFGNNNKKEETIMKTSSKWMVSTIVLATVMCLYFASVYAQSPAGDVKPTFISPTPGLYVHGWPAFTVSYPKEWVEQPPTPMEVFRVGALRQSLPPSPLLGIYSFGKPEDISGSADFLATNLARSSKDIKVLSNKPSKLQDGTPAQEAEIEWVAPSGLKWNTFLLATKKEGVWIWINLSYDKGKIEEDLKNIAYSLKVPQGKPEPVKLPPDIRGFLDKHCRDIETGDAAKVITNFSDQFLNNGMKKAAQEQWLRSSPLSGVVAGVASNEMTVTVFEPQGDRAYLAGFIAGTLKSGAPFLSPMNQQHMIKENGQWKWYGNQK